MTPDEAKIQKLKIIIAVLACSYFIPWSIAILNLLYIIAQKS